MRVFGTCGPQFIGPHHPRYTLVVDEMTPSVKLVSHASISIAGQFVLDVLNNRNEFGIERISDIFFALMGFELETR